MSYVAYAPCYRRRRQTPTDTSEQNNTGPLGGPVITILVICIYCIGIFLCNVRAAYLLAGCNFRQFFYAIWYLPVKSFAVSSLLDYPVVCCWCIQTKLHNHAELSITIQSSSAVERLFSAASQVLIHADAAWLMRQADAHCLSGNDFTDWKGCFRVLVWLKTAWNNRCHRFVTNNISSFRNKFILYIYNNILSHE